MADYEYRVVPAPTKGLKAKGVRTPEARFSNALETAINEMGADGWEYLRAESLPATERSGFRAASTVWRSVLIFRKQVATDAPVETQKRTLAPEPPLVSKPATPQDDASQSEGARRMLVDNGVEEPSDVADVTNSLKQLAASRNISKTSD